MINFIIHVFIFCFNDANKVSPFFPEYGKRNQIVFLLSSSQIITFIFWMLKLTVMNLIYFTRPHTQGNILISQARLHGIFRFHGLKRCTAAKKICCRKRNFPKQPDKIKKFMSWNGYPSHVRNSVIKCLKSNQQRNETNKEEDNIRIIWLRFPYLGKRVKLY